MKWPSIIQQYLPGNYQSAFDQAPWYDIQFWQTRFRFRCPPPSWRYPKAHKHLFKIDKGPFVNSESRQQYVGNDDDLFQSIIALRTGWNLRTRPLFAGSPTHLQLELTGLGVTKAAQSHFPHVFEPAIAKEWLTQIYREKHAVLGQMGLLPSHNRFSEIVFTDESTAKEIAQDKNYTINTVQINDHLAYECRPFANYLDYFIPFSPHDILQIGFSIEAKDSLDADTSNLILQEAKVRVNTILSSLTVQTMDSNSHSLSSPNSDSSPGVPVPSITFEIR